MKVKIPAPQTDFQYLIDMTSEFAFVYKTSAIKVHPYVVPHFYFYNSLT